MVGKFTELFTALAGLTAIINPITATVQVTYHAQFSDPTFPLDSCACSNGANGLITKYGWTEIGQAPDYPYVGSASAVTGWNSPECGTCWSLTYPATGKTIYILAIDYCGAGFDITEAAMNTLTNGQAYQLGIVQVNSAQVDVSHCGL